MPKTMLDRKRLNAVLVLRGVKLSFISAAAGCSLGHLMHVIAGERVGAPRLFDAIRAATGEAGWLVATGEVTVLDEKAIGTFATERRAPQPTFDDRIAHHEAGHAVAAVRGSFTVELVELGEPGGYAVGRTILVEDAYRATDAGSAPWLDRYLLFCLAGREAEIRAGAGQADGPVGGEDDLDEAALAIARFLKLKIPDDAQERAELRWHPSVAERLTLAQQHAADFVTRELPFIRTVAQHLLEQGALLGVDLARAAVVAGKE